jgi:hypothetical protein
LETTITQIDIKFVMKGMDQSKGTPETENWHWKGKSIFVEHTVEPLQGHLQEIITNRIIHVRDCFTSAKLKWFIEE